MMYKEKRKTLDYHKYSFEAWRKVSENNPNPSEEKELIIKPRPKYLYLEIDTPGNKHWIKLHHDLNHIYKEIEKSRYILELPDNWDDEGSSKYEKQTWLRAVKFLAHNAQCIYDRFGEVIETPIIAQSINGSIDIYWRTDQYYLLINIPQDPSEFATYYGENLNSKEHTEGSKKEDSLPLMLCLETVKK